jgi:predicted RNA-binding Zn-ribbon protein involved in translation (DUF1610 family)
MGRMTRRSDRGREYRPDLKLGVDTAWPNRRLPKVLRELAEGIFELQDRSDPSLTTDLDPGSKQKPTSTPPPGTADHSQACRSRYRTLIRTLEREVTKNRQVLNQESRPRRRGITCTTCRHTVTYTANHCPNCGEATERSLETQRLEKVAKVRRIGA